MANSSFSGPIRSQNGFQTISVNASTGAVTVTGTLGTTTSIPGTMTVLNNSGVTAGGAAGFLATNVAAGLGVYFGSGAPTVSAGQGSLYLRTDGSSTSTRAYVNTNGTTGWAAITTAS